MPSAFLSYARADFDRVRPLIEAFPREVSLWRDQEQIYGGEKWPKKIGEAIDQNEFFLLVWSANSAKSYFVESEWCIAFALKKTIIPCTLDKTSLPASLKGLEKIPIDASNPTATAAKVMAAFQAGMAPVDTARRSSVLDKLETITAVDEKKVAAELQTGLKAFFQDNWTVGGHVFQVGSGSVTVNFQNGTPPHVKDSWWDRLLKQWQAVATLIVTVLTGVFLMAGVPDMVMKLINPRVPTQQPVKDNNGGSLTETQKALSADPGAVSTAGEGHTPKQVEQPLGGTVEDANRRPLAGARVTLPEFPGVVATADEDGRFRVSVKAPTGRQVHLRVEKTDYEPYELDPALGQTNLIITLQKAL